MTLAEMIIQGQDLLGETEGTEGAASPFAWKRNLKNAADTIARATHALYRTYSLDLAPGQSDYCAPPLYHITAGSALSSMGVPHVLRIVKPLGFVPRDRSTLTQGVDPLAWGLMTAGEPQDFAVLGAGTIRLYDTPSYGTTGAIIVVPPAIQGKYGLVLEGFGTCADLWSLPTDACPLPLRGHLAAVYHATSVRAAQMKDFSTAQYYDGLYQSEKGYLEAEAATVTRPESGRQQTHGALSLAALAVGSSAPASMLDGGYLG